LKERGRLYESDRYMDMAMEEQNKYEEGEFKKDSLFLPDFYF
jgi:hypothetical protein